MKIVSKFKDFYDYADGFTKEPVYVRETVEENKNYPLLISLGFSDIRIRGIIRVGYKIYWSLSNGRFCNSLNEVLDYVTGPAVFQTRIERKLYDERGIINMNNSEPVEFVSFYEMIRESNSNRYWYEGLTRIENPQLSRYFDPLLFPLTKEQICQEITAWLYNYPVDSRPIPKIDDVTLAESKGYDKYSFRKAPK